MVVVRQRVIVAQFPWILRLMGLLALLFGGGWAMQDIMEESTFTGASLHLKITSDIYFPGIFAVVGLVMALIRYRVVVDGEIKSLVKHLGWGWWIRRTSTSLANCTHIEVGHAEARERGSDRYVAHPLRAVSPAGSEELAESRTLEHAWGLARKIAETLAISAVSEAPCAGEVHVFYPDMTGNRDSGNLREPKGTRVKVQKTPRDVRIQYGVPSGGVAVILCQALLGAAAVGGMMWVLWERSEEFAPFDVVYKTVWCTLLFGNTIGHLMWQYRHGYWGGRLEVSAELGLRCGGRWLRPGEIRVIEVMPGWWIQRGLRVVTGTATWRMCCGQSLADLQWIRSVIIEELHAAPSGASCIRDARTGANSDVQRER